MPTNINDHFRREAKLIFVIPALLVVLGILASILVPKFISRTPANNEINLSDEAVSNMSKNELWKIGVEHFNWPINPEENLSKNLIHQKLLDAKYAAVGDHLLSSISLKTAIEKQEDK